MIAQSSPRSSHHAAPVHEPPAVVRATGLVVALTLGLAILFIAFGLPAVRSAPYDVPIGIVAPEAVVGQIDAQLEQNAPPNQGSARMADRIDRDRVCPTLSSCA
jgi:hypothetical protein